MSTERWTDHVIGERMAVDREFTDRVAESEFSRQEWGLIMTATEFEIENPESDDARLVADTTRLPDIMPELEKVQSQMNAMGGGGKPKSGGGFLDSVKNALGLGERGVDPERVEAARRLVQEYATELQRRLEENGRWTDVREASR